MTPIEVIREAARESRERDCQFLKEPYPALNAIHTHGPGCANPELGQWREATEKACDALDWMRKRLRSKTGLTDEPKLTTPEIDVLEAALSAVAEKLRSGR